MRLERLCETGKADELAQFIKDMNGKESHISGSKYCHNTKGQGSEEDDSHLLQIASPTLHVVKQGIIWIKQILDNINFQATESPSLFKQYVRCANTMLQTIHSLSTVNNLLITWSHYNFAISMQLILTPILQSLV